MIVLFAERKSKILKEITEILKSYGADLISDKEIRLSKGAFTVVTEHKKTDISFKKGIAVFCDDTERFLCQVLPIGTVGICDSENRNALSVFKKNKIAVVDCSTNSKSTVTVSSIEKDFLFISLQRTVTDMNGNEIEPAEYKIKLGKEYQPFSYMAAVSVLLLNGIKP